MVHPATASRLSSSQTIAPSSFARIKTVVAQSIMSQSSMVLQHCKRVAQYSNVWRHQQNPSMVPVSSSHTPAGEKPPIFSKYERKKGLVFELCFFSTGTYFLSQDDQYSWLCAWLAKLPSRCLVKGREACDVAILARIGR